MPAHIIDEAGFKKGSLVKKIVGYALKAIGLSRSEVSILLTDDLGIKELNRKFRRINRPTDVLSFPMEDEKILGDIAVSVDRVFAQAREFKVSMEEELSRLLVHGLLHLAEYDHVKGGRQAKRMKEMEEELLGGLRKKGLFNKGALHSIRTIRKGA